MGCEVWGTSRTAEKLEKAKPLGLDHAIDTSHEDFSASVGTIAGHAGVDVVIDLLGGMALERNLAAPAPKGRLVLVGLLAGSQAPLDLNVMLRKRLTIVGTTLRARPLEDKIAATQRFAAPVVPWLERSRGSPDRRFGVSARRGASGSLEARI